MFWVRRLNFEKNMTQIIVFLHCQGEMWIRIPWNPVSMSQPQCGVWGNRGKCQTPLSVSPTSQDRRVCEGGQEHRTQGDLSASRRPHGPLRQGPHLLPLVFPPEIGAIAVGFLSSSGTAQLYLKLDPKAFWKAQKMFQYICAKNFSFVNVNQPTETSHPSWWSWRENWICGFQGKHWLALILWLFLVLY